MRLHNSSDTLHTCTWFLRWGCQSLWWHHQCCCPFTMVACISSRFPSCLLYFHFCAFGTYTFVIMLSCSHFNYTCLYSILFPTHWVCSYSLLLSYTSSLINSLFHANPCTQSGLKHYVITDCLLGHTFNYIIMFNSGFSSNFITFHFQ